MENIQIDLIESGTTTLATAGKYCDRNIDVNTDGVFEAGKEAEHRAFWDDALPEASTTVGIGYAPYYFAGNCWTD